MELTKKDIKILKYEKRIGFIFAEFILVFAALINLGYILKNPEVDRLLL